MTEREDKFKAIPVIKDVPWSGEIDRERAIDLFIQIARNRKTGVLKLHREKINKEFYFLRGWLLFGRSNVVNECLGRMLYDGGKISKPDLDRILEIMKKEKRKQGEIFIDLGLLNPDEIYFALKFQLKRRTIDVIKWEGGQYQFVEGSELDPAISDIMRISIPAVVYEGIKEAYKPEKIRDLLEPFLNEYLAKIDKPPFQPRDLGFLKNEEDLYVVVNGYRILREIYTLSKMVMRSTYQVLFTLLRLGMIEFRVMEEAVLEKQDRQRITELYRDMRGQNFFAILGVNEDVSPGELEEAFHRRVRDISPPEGINPEPEVQRIRAEIERNYKQAYELLSDRTRRGQYLERMRKEREEEAKTEADKAVLGADLEFQRGETFLFWKQDYKAAVESLTNAVRLNPKEATYLATLALAVYSQDKSKINNAREMINQALAKDPRCDKAYLYMGKILISENNKAEAARYLQKAVDLNPGNKKALKSL